MIPVRSPEVRPAEASLRPPPQGGAGFAALALPATASAATPPLYDVQASYGATGNGTTDDTTSIQNVINAANAAGGGTVYFPKGTYITRTLTLYSNILLRGAGIESTVLKLKASTNAAVVQSSNFSSLTGTNSSGGISAFGIADLTIDGNKANNTSGGHGLRLYGYNYLVRDVRIRQCKNDGLYSEYGSGGPSPGGDQMDAQLVDVKSHDNDGDGILWKGPHDSVWVNIDTFLNGAKGIETAGNGLGVQMTNIHSWGTSQTNAIYLGTGGILITNCQAEGSTGPQIMVLDHTCQITGARVFNGFTATNLGIQFGDATHDVSGTIVDAYITACTDGALKFVNDSGGNIIRAWINQGSGTPIVGTPHSWTRIEAYVGGGASGSQNAIPANASLGLGGSGGPTMSTGYGSPEGAITAPVGSLYLRRDGSGTVPTTLYVKTSGTGTTGWQGAQ